jgi:phosphoribosyl 1,2-cyclic phosphodiesterase
MMNFQTISTGSKGNCYILTCNGRKLIIEAGVNIKRIKEAIDFDWANVDGCIITHEHNDHAQSAAMIPVEVSASAGTLNAIGIVGNPMKAMVTYKVGSFTVMPFDVMHDAVEPFGFIIYHPEIGKVLFITDTYYVKYRFPDINHIIIEANYCEDIIAQKDGFIRDRVIRSHMSIQTCIGFLKANDLRTVESITLIHLSDGNSNEIEFKRKIEEATGKVVMVV